MVSNRFFGYATEDKDTFRKLSNQYHVILFTDRNNVPRMEQIADTQKLHTIAGHSDSKRPGEGIGHHQFRLVVASMICACLACRGISTQKCPYEPSEMQKSSVLNRSVYKMLRHEIEITTHRFSSMTQSEGPSLTSTI
jgi:hypothetical protein